MDGLGRKGDAAFQQESANVIDQRRATLHQPIPHPVHGLPVELFLRLELGEAHVLLGHRFGDRLGIDEVALVRLPVRLYKLCWEESHLVSLLPQHRS